MYYVLTLNLMLTSKLSCSLTLDPLNKTRGESFLDNTYTMCTPPGILSYKKWKSQTGLSTTETRLIYVQTIQIREKAADKSQAA